MQHTPSPATIHDAVRRAKEKLAHHVAYGTAVYEAAMDAGIEPSTLYAEMSRRSKAKRQRLARERDRRAA